MMDQLVAAFPDQLKEALEIGQNLQINPGIKPINRILVVGMGGSGIGADFVANFIRKECPIPYLVSKGYTVPAYVDEQTLGIFSSYSGNTEETLSSFEAMLGTEAKIVCLSSGGKLKDMAKKHELDFVQMPPGSESPRACLGYSVVLQLAILRQCAWISERRLEEVAQAADMLKSEQDTIKERAEHIARLLVNKIPVIYSTNALEPVALRFRQQLNENAKMLGWHQVIPEMNHNELVGWRQQYPDLAALFLRTQVDHPRNQVRIDIVKEIIGNFAGSVIEIYARGQSLIERSFYLVHLLDWVSVFLAEKRGVDATEIKVIDFLKGELGKV